MKFKGYFIRTNNSMGCVISEADNTLEAIKRTIFDAIYKSPWTEEDITVLRIVDFDSDSIVYSFDMDNLSVDFKTILGS